MINILKQLAIFSPFIVSLFAFVGLFVKYRNEDKAKFLLSMFMLASAVYYFLCILRNYISIEKYCYLYIFQIALLLLAIPQVYFYIRELTVGNPLSNQILIHCLPAALIFVFGSISFFSMEPGQRVLFVKDGFFINNENYVFSIIYLIFNMVFISQFIGYYIYASKLLKTYRNELNHIFSDISGLELNWVNFFLSTMLFWGILGNYKFTIFLEPIPFLNDIKYIIDLLISILICGLYLFGTIQKSISNYKPAFIEEAKEDTINITNHKLKEKLLDCIEKQEIYLKKDFTIWDLSREINSNRTYTSNLINDEFGMNFNTFVNQYRVKKAKILLKDEQYAHLNLESLAQMAGFNSLASFNRAFQKFENTSPGNFRAKPLEYQDMP